MVRERERERERESRRHKKKIEQESSEINILTVAVAVARPPLSPALPDLPARVAVVGFLSEQRGCPGLA